MTTKAIGKSATGWRPWPRRLRLHRPRITRGRLILLGVFVAILGLWAAVTVLSTSRYSTTVLFADPGTGIGLPPPDQRLDFGDVPAGTAMHRNINLKNSGNLDAFVVVIPWGGIRDFFHVDDAFFNMSPGEEHNVDFSVYAPADSGRQRHSGSVYIVRIPYWWPF